MALSETAQQTPAPKQAWYRTLTGYHWLVLVVCTMAWSFDCLNQQIFNLSRMPAMAELMNTTPGDPSVGVYGGYGTSGLLLGWATGGIIFGILGDRLGRAKTLVIMILCYSLSTGLCGISQSPWQYIFFCFVTGMGAGGIFPVGCTLVAESLPNLARPHALGMMQTFSAIGNVSAGLISLLMVALFAQGMISSQWRWLFAVGILPALLSIIVARKLHEPEVWRKAMAAGGGKKVGSLKELFGDPKWRPRAIVGMVLAASGVVGLWGIGVFSADLTQIFIGTNLDEAARAAGQNQQDLQFVAQMLASPEAIKVAQDGERKIQPWELLGKDPKDTDAKVLYGAALALRKENKTISPAAVLDFLDQPDKEGKKQSADDRARREKLLTAEPSKATAQEHVERIAARQRSRGIEASKWAAFTLIMFNVGAFFGMYAFATITHRLGRRPTFAIFFLAAAVTTAGAFWFMSSRTDIFWMVPLMGAAQLSVFGGYAIYFPELFPTRLRSTGASFCYNVARYVAVPGPVGLQLLRKYAFGASGDDSIRYAGVAMCACFLVGIVALLFAPETKGQPLPE